MWISTRSKEAGFIPLSFLPTVFNLASYDCELRIPHWGFNWHLKICFQYQQVNACLHSQKVSLNYWSSGGKLPLMELLDWHAGCYNLASNKNGVKKKIIVLGAGLVGSAIAKDLHPHFEVTSADISEEKLGGLMAHGITTICIDLTHENIKSTISNFDLVIGAVPGFMGFNTVRAVIEAGVNMVDISFFAEDPFLLHEAASKKGLTIVTDCGVAPGMGNIILGYHHSKNKVVRYECLVGGLPVVREWPWEYKAVFSPIDVIEEYLRPARYVVNSKLVIREALSDAEHVHFPGIGTLESWNSDGLRSLIQTMSDIPDMIEKTLRYPGCIEYLRVLRAGGFFSSEEIELNGIKVKPIDLIAKLLFPKWKLKPGEEDYTVMRIVIEDDHKIHTYELTDRFDRENDILSMARTTGYTCSAVAHLVLDGKYDKKGISPPEYVGAADGCFDFVLAYLKERNVHYYLNEQLKK